MRLSGCSIGPGGTPWTAGGLPDSLHPPPPGTGPWIAGQREGRDRHRGGGSRARLSRWGTGSCRRAALGLQLNLGPGLDSGPPSSVWLRFLRAVHKLEGADTSSQCAQICSGGRRFCRRPPPSALSQRIRLRQDCAPPTNSLAFLLGSFLNAM